MNPRQQTIKQLVLPNRRVTMKYIYTALFTPIEDGSGYYAKVPDLMDASLLAIVFLMQLTKLPMQ